MSWLHPAVASAKRNHVDDIFFFFCRRCSSQLESCRKTWAMLVSHRPAVNHRVSTILAGLLTLTPYHDGCWAAGRPRPHFGNYLPRVYAQLFLLSAGYFQFNPKDILSRARRRERSLFFFIFLLCIDGRVSRRSRPDDVTTHSAESHTWLLLVVPMPPPFVFNGGKKPAALEIDLFLFRLVVPVVDSVSIETMCSSSSSSSSPLSSSLSFLTLSGQPNESYRSTARPAGKILKKE